MTRGFYITLKPSVNHGILCFCHTYGRRGHNFITFVAELLLWHLQPNLNLQQHERTGLDAETTEQEAIKFSLDCEDAEGRL